MSAGGPDDWVGLRPLRHRTPPVPLRDRLNHNEYERRLVVAAAVMADGLVMPYYYSTPRQVSTESTQQS